MFFCISLVSTGSPLHPLPEGMMGRRQGSWGARLCWSSRSRLWKQVFLPELSLLVLLSFLVFSYSHSPPFPCSFSPCRYPVLLVYLLAVCGYYFLPWPGLLQNLAVKVFCVGSIPTTGSWFVKAYAAHSFCESLKIQKLHSFLNQVYQDSLCEIGGELGDFFSFGLKMWTY